MNGQILLLIVFAGGSCAFLDSLFMQLDSSCTGKDLFTCRNSKCIPKVQRCDGRPDCLDSSDEEDCDVFLCREPNYFKCDNGKCISSSFRCDDENDCGDFSDEENCENFKHMITHASNCSAEEWQCVDHLCVPLEFVCNGENDCLDGTDETLGCTLNIHCDGFKCKDGHCVPNEWRCDGNSDCKDNSDELGCDEQIPIKDCTIDNDKFLCANNHTCIEVSKVCDARFDCPDQSDESNSCAKLKTCTKANCSHKCINLPTGPKCVCPTGYKTVNQNCVDVNECQEYGICDQKCRNSPGSYECYCDSRYILQDDKRTCKVIGGEALMIFSTKTEIRGYFLQSQLLYPVSKSLRQVVGVNFDGHHVYWTDIFSEHESLVRSLEDGSKRELLVTAGLGSPEDLAVDWVTGNIYFTDSEMQHIGVCTNDGFKCTVLVNKDIDKPRGIALHPSEGTMFWSDWGKIAEIAKSKMDGTEDQTFVGNDIHWPNGIAIDYPNDRLYWTDGKLMTLESIRLDGTDRRNVLVSIVKHPYAISVFENRLYWSDWATYSIQSCDKFTGKNHTTLIKEKREFIYGLHIFHSALKPAIENPCKKAGCSDICMLSGPNKYACGCPMDKKLATDKHSCKENTRRPILAIGAKDILVKLEHQKLGKQDIVALPTIAKEIGALAYDPNNHSIFVSDIGSVKRILQINLNTGFSKTIFSDGIGSINSMSFDYLGNNLFWCDSDKQTIEMLSISSMSHKVVMQDLGGELPMSVALMPEEGLLFVATAKAKHSHVDRMNFDGTFRSHVIESGLIGPISLHYDRFLNRIIWADAGSGQIESASLEGDVRHKFKALQTTPISVTSLQDEIFWSNHNSKRIYWSKSTGTLNLNKKITLDLPEGFDKVHLAAITPFQIPAHACRSNNGGCSHICIPKQKSFQCLCPMGMSLSAWDNSTCVKKIGCTPDEFFCTSSDLCIPRTLTCNGRKDCLFGEDEAECVQDHHCPSGFYQCSNLKCIRNSLVCNMHFDCEDRSDEANCKDQVKTCAITEFQCQNGKCINERFVCDGHNDCSEGEDEHNCLAATCTSEEFRCGTGACIPKNWECDHEFDCSDMSDEHSGCTLRSCPDDQFKCDNNFCIDNILKCNDIDDCGDNSDERRCEIIDATSICHPVEFQCSSNSSICLPPAARCNGTSECPHHEDEQGCSNCHVDEFECSNKKCITRVWLCDGHNDCGDNSDEEICDVPNLIASERLAPCDNGFRCQSGSCLDFRLVCNGVNDCHDGSDEIGACTTACKGRTSNPCDHECIPTPNGPMCACHEGFELAGDGQTCRDIEECKKDPPVCSQLCTEKIGSFNCACYDGFVIRTDKVSCKSVGPPMSLFFTMNNEIRQMSQSDHSMNVVYKEETPRITGIDISIEDRFVYFSIEESATIHRLHLDTGKREYISDLGRPQKLAIDWISKNVYYVEADNSQKSIQVCNFDQERCVKVIDVDPHSQITAIAVDAKNKYIFYALTSWWIFNNPECIVYKANMDGTNVLELIKTTPGSVTGLTMNPRTKTLYYADQHSGTISRINYDGSEKYVLFNNVTKPIGLQLFEDKLHFLTSYGYMSVCKLYGFERTCTSFRLNAYATEFFVIAQISLQMNSTNVCKSYNCDHMCAPHDFGASCLCENGKIVEENALCADSERSAGLTDKRPTFGSQSENEAPSGSTLATIFIICLIVIACLAVYYVIRRRNTGKFNVSIRFNNPIYGVQQEDAERTLILNPGEHEYCNPVNAHRANQIKFQQ